MAAKTASLSVNIIADAAKAKAGLKDAETSLQKFKREVGATNGVMGVFDKQANTAFNMLKQNALNFSVAAGAALVAFGASSVKAASNLKESVNAVQVTFGSASSSILEFGENAAKTVGMSQSQFNMFAVQFAGFAQKIGKSSGEVSGLIQDLSVRTADFASVMNLDVAEAARVFQSALAGETEPIKKFGIDMSAAAIEAYALSKGLARSKGEITESVKQVARYGLLMQETDKVAGDFKNTQDGLANSTRTLKARFEDLQADIGENLIPYIEELAGRALDLVDAFDMVGPTIKKVSDLASEGALAHELFGISVKDVAVNLAKFSSNSFVGVLNFMGLFKGESKDSKVAVEELRVAYKDWKPAIDDATQSSEELNKALQEQNDQLQKLYSATVAAFESDIAYEEAKRRTVDTVAEYNALLTSFVDGTYEGSNATQDLAAKTDDLYLSILNQGSAAVRAAEDMAKKTGAELTAQEAARIHREELDKVAGTLAVDSPLRRRLRDYMLELSRIERNISTTIKTIFVEERRVINADRKMARGGIVASPTMALIGEAGPEVVIPLTKPSRAQQLISQTGLDDMMASSALMSGGGRTGGGNTYINVSVDAGLVSSPDQVGQQIIEAIRRAERKSGKVFASS